MRRNTGSPSKSTSSTSSTSPTSRTPETSVSSSDATSTVAAIKKSKAETYNIGPELQTRMEAGIKKALLRLKLHTSSTIKPLMGTAVLTENSLKAYETGVRGTLFHFI